MRWHPQGWARSPWFGALGLAPLNQVIEDGRGQARCWKAAVLVDEVGWDGLWEGKEGRSAGERGRRPTAAALVPGGSGSNGA
jgi:hypothetical protein